MKKTWIYTEKICLNALTFLAIYDIINVHSVKMAEH